MEFIDSGKQQGATVQLGGERWGNEGYFIKPTIFTNTKKDMRIVQEEIFGPVGVVIKFDDDEDVIHQANDTVYGLAAAIFTKNIDRALRCSQALRAGTTWVRLTSLLPHRSANTHCRSTARTSSTHKYRSAASSSRVSAASSASTRCSTTPPSRPCTSTSATRSKGTSLSWLSGVVHT